MLFAAGLITGEALMGIMIGDPDRQSPDKCDVLALPRACSSRGSAGEWMGLALLGAVAYWMYSVGSSKSVEAA